MIITDYWSIFRHYIILVTACIIGITISFYFAYILKALYQDVRDNPWKYERRAYGANVTIDPSIGLTATNGVPLQPLPLYQPSDASLPAYVPRLNNDEKRLQSPYQQSPAHQHPSYPYSATTPPIQPNDPSSLYSTSQNNPYSLSYRAPVSYEKSVIDSSSHLK